MQMTEGAIRVNRPEVQPIFAPRGSHGVANEGPTLKVLPLRSTVLIVLVQKRTIVCIETNKIQQPPLHDTVAGLLKKCPPRSSQPNSSGYQPSPVQALVDI